MITQAPRGTYDATPNENATFRSDVLHRLEDHFFAVMARYGYGEVRTPMFEHTELFSRTSGDTSEVVNKQMYTFTDKGDRSVTLKPEGTAPAVRAYLDAKLGAQGGVTRLCYQTAIFRYERPQKGRYRQAHQFGLELFGSGQPDADAEIIEATIEFYRAIGLRDTVVLLNCIGRAESRARFREALAAYLAPWLPDQSDEIKMLADRNPLRLFDQKDPKVNEFMAGAPVVTDHLEDASRAHFDTLQALLTEAGVGYELRPEIVRGLDYFTDTVFEVHSALLGAQGALCGGGRYDNLVKEVGGPATPGVGVGMGVERAYIVLEAQGDLPPMPGLNAFVVAATEDAWPTVRTLCRALRKAGLSVQYDVEGKNLKGQMKQADRMRAQWAVILGTDELAAGQATIKNLATGEQRQVPQSDIAATVGA
jgi:histidyl-tRNA synthetase